MPNFRSTFFLCTILTALLSGSGAQAFDIYNGAPGLELPGLKQHRGLRIRDNTLSPELFEAMLIFSRDEKLGAVFWAQQSDRYFPDWLTALLAEYHAQ